MASIHIIGSSHIARDVVKEIKNFITTEKPDAVAVELDKNRLIALYSKKTRPSIQDIKYIGVMGFIFNLLGAHIQKKLGSKVHAAPGIDMKTAIHEAKKIGAQVYLIDRPIQKTLQRISKIPRKEKIKLVYYLLLGPIFQREEVKKFDLKSVPEDQTISKILKEFKKQLPKTYNVLIKERNEILARNIHFVRKANPAAKILVVIGAGHVQDVKNLLKNKYKIKNLF